MTDLVLTDCAEAQLARKYCRTPRERQHHPGALALLQLQHRPNQLDRQVESQVAPQGTERRTARDGAGYLVQGDVVEGFYPERGLPTLGWVIRI